MSKSSRDWDVRTGWEKRIKVEFGSIGPNHVRWSHWSDVERDIVARKVYEIEMINQTEGNRSKTADRWREENEAIMIDFARDGKTMPAWAHDDFQDSGIPDHVKVIWAQMSHTSPGMWAYDPPLGQQEIVGLETKGKMDEKYGGVISYKTMANGDHVDQNGNVISTIESRAKEDVPQWKKFELGRLEIVDNHVIPGPNALQKDIDQYGENVEKTGRKKKEKPIMNVRDIDTSQYISVTQLFGNKGDIVARVFINYPLDLNELIGRCFISDDSHVSMRVQEAAGSSDQVTVTDAKTLHFIVPKRSELRGEKQVKIMFYFRKKGQQIYRTKDWWCIKDLPQVESTNEVKAMSKPKRIMPSDMNYTSAEKATSWAKETQHGKAHQNRWNRVAATMGVANGYDAYSFDECKAIWEQFGKNARWTMVMSWFETDDEEIKGMEAYHSPLTMQGHYTLEDWGKLHDSEATICKIEGFDRLTIWDAGCSMPNFWLEGEGGQPTEQWRLMSDGGLQLVRYFSNDEMFGKAGAPTPDEVNAWRKEHGMHALEFPNDVEAYPSECVFRVPEDDEHVALANEVVDVAQNPIAQAAAELCETNDANAIETVLMTLLAKLGIKL